MKIATGLSVLLLGTTLLAGAAAAQNNNNNNNPPPQWTAPPHGGHGQSVSGGQSSGGPNSRGISSPRPSFGAQRVNPNRANWNRVTTFHDRNVAHFNAQDRAMWTRGQWRHTNHNGRNGWWWYTNGAWFFYDEPVYPYPGYVSDDYSFDDDGYYDEAPANDGYVWYHCDNPQGYYPYVRTCRGPWQPVEPTPQGGYDQGPQGGPDAYQDDDDERGPAPAQPPRGQYENAPGGPQQGYNNDNDDDDDDDQGPPPGYNNGYSGPQQGYDDEPPR